MWNNSLNSHIYQTKIEETTDKLCGYDDKLKETLSYTEYELFVELQQNIAYENSCIEALNIIYTRIVHVLKHKFFSKKEFMSILARVAYLKERPLGKMHYAYTINYDDIYTESIKIESVIEIFNEYLLNMDLLVEEIEEVWDDYKDHALLGYIHSLSELYSHFFYKYIHTPLEKEEQEKIQQSHKSMIEKFLSIQKRTTTIKTLLKRPQWEKLMTMIFDENFLADWEEITHRHALHLLLCHIYFVIWRFELETHICLSDHHISNEDLLIADTIQACEKAKRSSQECMVSIRNQLKSFQIYKPYKEHVTYTLWRIYRMLKRYSQQEISILNELYEMLQDELS